VESGFLMLFAWNRRRVLRRLVRDWRQPFLAFIFSYAAIFTVIFAAATSNFGIIVRQRIMLLPLVLMLFCARPETEETPAPQRRNNRVIVPTPANGREQREASRQFLPRPVATARTSWKLRHFTSRNRFQS